MTTPPERSTRILIVQDEPAAAARLAADLERLGHTVCGTVASGWQAVAQAAELMPELALVELGCDDATGEATEHLVGQCQVPVLYLVGGHAGQGIGAGLDERRGRLPGAAVHGGPTRTADRRRRAHHARAQSPAAAQQRPAATAPRPDVRRVRQHRRRG